MASIKKYYLKKSKEYRYEVYISNGIDPGTKVLSYRKRFIKKGLKVMKKQKDSQKLSKAK